MNVIPPSGKTHPMYHAAIAAFASVLLLSSGAAGAQPVNYADTPSTMRVDPVDGAQQVIGVRAGNHGEYRNASIFWQSPVWWTHRFNNGGHVDILGEVAATWWHSRNHGPKTLWQFGAKPVVRWWPTSQRPFFVEAGAGATVVSRTDFASYHLSTALQFSPHVGMGYVFNKRHQVMARLSHYSNARIKRPNNGLNVFEIEYGVRF